MAGSKSIGKTRKKIIGTILKIAVSIFILYLIFTRIDLEKVIGSIGQIIIYYAVVYYFLLVMTIPFLVLKWKIFIGKYSDLGFFKLFHIYWASDFVSMFGVGAIGGEAYKMICFRDKKKALFSSVVDKGYTFLWYIIFGAYLYLLQLLIGRAVYSFVAASVLFFISVWIIMTLISKLHKPLVRIIPIRFIKRAIRESLRERKHMMLHSFYSYMLLHVKAGLFIVSLWMVGMQADFIYSYIAVVVLTILIILPISFQGLGVREFTYVQYASLMGLDQGKALVASFSVYIIATIYRLCGLPFFLTLKNENNPKEG